MYITANQFPKHIIISFQIGFKLYSTGSHCFDLFHHYVKIDSFFKLFIK